MYAIDENALCCDFAETYQILNWRGLPARLAATLAAGFRPDSRMMMKISGAAAPTESLLLFGILDALRVLVWQNSRDGANGKNPPKSMLDMILSKNKENTAPSVGFDSPEEFMQWRETMLTGGDDIG